jgi:prepilin-type N-terminal cleavage/methylation domain-containing protein
MRPLLSARVTGLGFSLTELLTSITIVAILAAIALYYGAETLARIRAIFE